MNFCEFPPLAQSLSISARSLSRPSSLACAKKAVRVRWQLLQRATIQVVDSAALRLADRTSPCLHPLTGTLLQSSFSPNSRNEFLSFAAARLCPLAKLGRPIANPAKLQPPVFTDPCDTVGHGVFGLLRRRSRNRRRAAVQKCGGANFADALRFANLVDANTLVELPARLSRQRQFLFVGCQECIMDFWCHRDGS